MILYYNFGGKGNILPKEIEIIEIIPGTRAKPSYGL